MCADRLEKSTFGAFFILEELTLNEKTIFIETSVEDMKKKYAEQFRMYRMRSE
jgi:hypothetical protein